MAIGKINGIAISGGGSVLYDEILAAEDPVFNDSSAGESDVAAGSISYVELPSQTRETMPSGYVTGVGLVCSGHASAGQALFQLWNQDDSDQIAVTSTTSTSETHLSISANFLNSNKGDQVTLRVANTVIGETTFLDSGGFAIAKQIATLGGTTSPNDISNLFNSNNTSWSPYFVKSIKIMPLKRKSTATFSMDVGAFLTVPATITSAAQYTDLSEVYDTLTEADHGTVQTVNFTRAHMPLSNSSTLGRILWNKSELDSNSTAYAVTFNLCAFKFY